jgi:hypothetical protein
VSLEDEGQGHINSGDESYYDTLTSSSQVTGPLVVFRFAALEIAVATDAVSDQDFREILQVSWICRRRPSMRR